MATFQSGQQNEDNLSMTKYAFQKYIFYTFSKFHSQSYPAIETRAKMEENVRMMAIRVSSAHVRQDSREKIVPRKVEISFGKS